jgi:hypothetical protein
MHGVVLSLQNELELTRKNVVVFDDECGACPQLGLAHEGPR